MDLRAHFAGSENPMVDSFTCSFLATALNARSGICSVVEQLRVMGLPEARANDVQIVLSEAVNNVVEHAYANALPGDVRIQCNLNIKQLWINIHDDGGPLPEGKLPAGLPVDVSAPTEELPEGGFGWFLIRELTSEIQYERKSGNNQLSLCFEIGTNSI